MKIGIVTTWFERGAAYVSKQYEQILELENDIFIYARGGEEYAKGDKIWDKENVHWGKKENLPVGATYINKNDFIEWIKRNKIEIILFNEQRWWQPIIIAKELGIKCGAYIDYYTENTLELFNSYDFLICNTKKHYEAFSFHNQAHYIPWGTDINLFNYHKNIKNQSLTFFHSAGMNPYRKGTDFVIKAFAKLVEKYTDVQLIIHTQTELKDSLSDLEDTILKLLKSRNLQITNKTITAPGIYYKGDVYVYPSRLEGIGLTIIEALASGLPIIVPNNGPMNEFVSKTSKVVDISKLYSRSDGYYWPICEISIPDLVEKMSYYVENKSNILEYKNEAREFAVKNFNWMNNKEKLNNLFKNITYSKLDKKLKLKLTKEDNIKYKYIVEYPYLYKIIYKIYNVIKKVIN